MRKTEHKILNITDAQLLVKEWKILGDKIVFTNGCFDILHLGHVDYLEKASEFGNRLIIGVNNDLSISKLKGPSRPIINEYARLRVIASLSFVDLVILFDETTPIELIKVIAPNILVKAKDYSINKIVGSDFILQSGGEVKTIDFVDGYSTSSIIQKIKNC